MSWTARRTFRVLLAPPFGFSPMLLTQTTATALVYGHRCTIWNGRIQQKFQRTYTRRIGLVCGPAPTSKMAKEVLRAILCG